MILLNAVQESA